MRHALFALAALPALTAAPLHAEVRVLKPQSPWNADFGEERCRLVRAFAEGDDKYMLYFEQTAPATGAGLSVAGKAFTPFTNETETFLTIADGAAPLEMKPFKGEQEGFGPALIYSGINLAYNEPVTEPAAPQPGVPALDTAYANKVQYLAFRQRGGQEVRFATGPLGKAFAVLNQCTASLIGTWGLDAEKHMTAQRLPQWTNRDAVVKAIVSRYPGKARNIGEQGIVRMRVTVSETGTVEDCSILKFTDAERLESPACEAMRDARFDPALDAAGQPMRSYYVTSITYDMK